jgi:hypothetical protein
MDETITVDHVGGVLISVLEDGNEFALEVALELAFRGDGTNFEPDESLLSIGNFGDDYGKAETIRLAARKPAPSAFLTGVC